jgi:hypothetical protein
MASWIAFAATAASTEAVNLSEVEKSVATRHNLALRATTHRLPYRLTISAGSVVLNPVGCKNSIEWA